MEKILLLGAGKIGGAIVDLLSATGDYQLTVVDRDAAMLGDINREDVACDTADISDSSVLRRLMGAQNTVISALPFYLNVKVAEAAQACKLNYFDMTEDVETARAIRSLAEGSANAFVPQCGLAPGFISVAAYDLAKRFDELHTVRMRVGALPKYPTNALNYNLTWSTDGLINEYCNLCEAIHDGERREVLPLQGFEQFSLDGITYEAFNTSGGLGTLCDTLEGKVRELNYKTVRYPGHCDQIKMLVNDLRLGERRELFRDVLEFGVPMTLQDVVLIFVTVIGMRGGRLSQESYAHKIYAHDIGDRTWSAIQVATASATCAMVDLLRGGQLMQSGFVRQEDVTLDNFRNNRFGRYYVSEGD